MAADAETLKVNDRANGSSVALQLGQFLEICLPANLGTGYSWTVSSAPNEILKLLAKDVRPTAEKDKVGGTERQIFRFQVVARGSGGLELQYRRPWEKDTPPAKKYSLVIKVQ
jgi:inhibitor of cysteine peptidase